MSKEMESTVKLLAAKGKGILAADESTGTIAKRFASINIENSEENRRAYRDLLFTTEGLADYVSGVILYEETLGQKSKDGTPFPHLLEKLGIVPGIKVDMGLIPLINGKDEKVTQGLDGLPERLAQYKKQGAKFAKWRAVFNIDDMRPTSLAMATNAECLARYAAICQSQGIVPIVEPELLIDGTYTLERSAEATENVLHCVFNALQRHQVILEQIVLKPSMVVSGKDCPKQASIDEVAKATVITLLRTVPAAVPTINFLSGGQTSEEATAHLNRMNALYPNLPWNLSFSYGRALQDHALKAWLGNQSNAATAQKALHKRARLNAVASQGKYSKELEVA